MLGWEELRAVCEGCTACPLCEGRNRVVFGVGATDAELMFIGEGPGAQEDLTGEPFVGPAGQLLDDYLEAVGLSRARVYIANVVKCRPPGNRDPSAEEQEACIGYLRNQVALIRPKLIVALGRIAACRIIDPHFRITKDHGIWYDRKGCRLMATYHPSALLRDPSKRPDAFLDFKSIEAEVKKSCEHT